MRRDRSAAVVLFLIAAAAGCGGGAREPEMVIEFERRELLADAARIAVYFYTGAIGCDEIRAAIPRPQSVLGPFSADVGEQGRTQGTVFRLDAVPANTYVVFVDAIDSSGTIVGSGCAPGQQVFEGAVSRIRIKIS
jgi:hypothetical protein